MSDEVESPSGFGGAKQKIPASLEGGMQSKSIPQESSARWIMQASQGTWKILSEIKWIPFKC